MARMFRSVRGCWLAAMAVSGVAAPAVRASAITLQSGGSAMFAGSQVSGSETVVAEVGGNGPLTTLSYLLDTTTDTGSGSYVGPLETLDFDFTFSPTDVVNSGASESISGSFKVTGGTGGYAETSGTGTFNLNYLTSAAGTTSSTLVSAVLSTPSEDPVPEPGTWAVVGNGMAIFFYRSRFRRNPKPADKKQPFCVATL